MNNKLLINHPNFVSVLKNEPLVLIDGGARGEVSRPFENLNKEVLIVVRFEPDNEAEIVSGKNEIEINKGIWDSDGKIKFHLAIERSVSSVLPPDLRLVEQMLVKDYLIDERKTEKIVEVDVTTLDKLVETKAIPPIDFIKLDIHGSEYEAIKGSINTMKNSLLGVLAETWSTPIHLGQKNHSHFGALLNDYGIYLWEQLATGKVLRNTKKSKFNKHQMLKFDSLFFKDVIDIKSFEISKTKALKYIGLADLFQHYGYCLQLNEYFYHTLKIYDKAMFDLIENTISKRNDFKVKMFQKIIGALEKKICTFS